MLTNRTKLIVTVSLAILVCIFGCVGLARVAQKGSEGQAPIRGLRIVIDVNRREELIAELRKFAVKHDFEILTREVEVSPDGIFIEMYRDDLKITAASVPDAPTKIDLNFYERNPANPTPEETVDELFSDLKSLISEIPNVILTEE